MTLQTTATLANSLPDVYVETRFVDALRAKLVVAPLGRPSTLPDNSGKKVRWNYFSNPTTNVTTALSEGTDPSDITAPSINAAEGTLLEYAGKQPFSRFLVRSAVSGTMDEIIKYVGYNGAWLMDMLTQKELSNIAAGSKIDLGAGMSADGLRRAAAFLSGAGRGSSAIDAGAFSFPTGAPGPAEPHSSTPGGQFYCAVLSAEAAYDMIGEGAPSWFQAKSRDVEAALTTPLRDTPATAAAYGCIVKISQAVLRDNSTAPDNDLNYVVGNDLFGTAALDIPTLQPRVIVTMPEQNIAAPARNWGVVAFWFLYVAKLIDSNRGVQLATDATGIG